MCQEELRKKLSKLEAINDQLLTELRYIDDLMRKIGFQNGIQTLKMAAHEILEEDQDKRR